MKKLGIIAVLGIAILLLGLPPVLGSLTEMQVHRRVAAIDAGDTWSAEVQSFERGWFRSHATIELGLAPEYLAPYLGAQTAGPAMAAVMGRRALLAVDFAHGPIAVLDGVHFGASKMIARLDPNSAGVGGLQEFLAVPYLFEFRGRTSFAGGLTFDADIPPIALPVEQAQFDFSGAFLDGTFNGRQLRANARVDALAFASPSGAFALDNLRANVDNEIRSAYVMPGSAGFSIARVSMFDAARGATPVFEAVSLRADSTVDVDVTGALLDMQMTGSLDSVRADDLTITDTNLGVAVRSIDIAAMEAYFAAMRSLAVSPTALDPGAALADLGPLVERGLAAGPSLTLEPIRLRVDDEPFDGRLVIATNAASLPPAGAIDLRDPALWFALLDSNAQFTASKALTRRLAVLVIQMQYGSDALPPEQLQYMAEAQAGLVLLTLVGRGILTDAGDSYRTEAHFTDGALTVNGAALPFGLP
jgi:uncharacterized protein YdgA (DUF945 family)